MHDFRSSESSLDLIRLRAGEIPSTLSLFELMEA